MELDVIEIQVKDFQKSVEWYKQLFKVLHLEDNFSMLDTGKATLALYKGEKNTTTLYFRSKKLKDTHKILRDKGVSISDIEKVHWGQKFSFKDPEGNIHFVYSETKDG